MADEDEKNEGVEPEKPVDIAEMASKFPIDAESLGLARSFINHVKGASLALTRLLNLLDKSSGGTKPKSD